MFFIGQKVICINDLNIPPNIPGPKKGYKYTIRGIYESKIHKEIGLLLEEVKSGIFTKFGEKGYSSSRFRSLSTQGASKLIKKIKIKKKELSY